MPSSRPEKISLYIIDDEILALLETSENATFVRSTIYDRHKQHEQLLTIVVEEDVEEDGPSTFFYVNDHDYTTIDYKSDELGSVMNATTFKANKDKMFERYNESTDRGTYGFMDIVTELDNLTWSYDVHMEIIYRMCGIYNDVIPTFITELPKDYDQLNSTDYYVLICMVLLRRNPNVRDHDVKIKIYVRLVKRFYFVGYVCTVDQHGSFVDKVTAEGLHLTKIRLYGDFLRKRFSGDIKFESQPSELKRCGKMELRTSSTL